MDIILYGDYDDMIFNVFFEEYIEYCSDKGIYEDLNYHDISNEYWNDFLSNKGLGIRYMGLVRDKHEYTIVDKKVWLLSKIKYGI